MPVPLALFLLALVLGCCGFRCVRSLTLAPGLEDRQQQPRLSPLVTADSVDVSADWPPSHPGFFAEQLALCRRLIEEDDAYRLNASPSAQPERRTRFVEHPRCTARFGEVLLHARNEATTEEDYHQAVYNARAVVQYVENATGQQDGREELLFERLSSALASALSSRSLVKFRRRQLDLCAEEYLEAKGSGEDFPPEEADLKTLGRLYYSAIRASEPVLSDIELSPDHGGFTVLLALCRAASAATAPKGNCLTESGRRLDASLSAHFNGIRVPGCRFLFSPRHGLDHKSQRRASRLIVAFSSLGNGLVRHEFGATLAKLNSGRVRDDEEHVFDVLFVADPAQSWYQKDSLGGFGGFAEYEKRIRAASHPYSHVSLLGDSMGASAALIFSHLATDAVVGFSPQVDLRHDDHVGRDDLTPVIRQRFLDRLMESVGEATARGVKVTIHRGVEEADVWHTGELVKGMQRNGFDPRTEGPRIIEHGECSHHQTAVHLKQRGTLSEYISLGLLEDSIWKNDKSLSLLYVTE